MEAEELLIVSAALVCIVALYAARATHDRLRRDWPARKIRVRDGSATSHGPFRALEHTGERDVSAGPPWAVHLAALLGHGISALSFFGTIALWFSARAILLPDTQLKSDFPAWWLLLSVACAFAIGRYQWIGSTVALATDYRAAHRHVAIALLARLVIDGVPIALLVATASSDALAAALATSVPMVHALFAWIAVRASKRHYEAAAIALEERRAATSGTVAH